MIPEILLAVTEITHFTFMEVGCLLPLVKKNGSTIIYTSLQITIDSLQPKRVIIIPSFGFRTTSDNVLTVT